MSLNGLDDQKVAEAHQAALAEAGGWFLLKYTSRDAVELHARGSGGVPEARGAIAEYEDKSPLYGFLIYRRRKVLVKYIPEGTSRLVQARVTVHFQSFEDRFRPHDTVIIIAAANELTDIALSAACQLHSAAETTRSSGGSIVQQRKSKLDEIVEDPKERPSYDARAASIEKPSAPLPAEPTIPESAEKDLPSLPFVEQDRPSTRGSHRSNQPPTASRKAAAILGIPVTDVSATPETSSLRPISPPAAGDTASLYAASLGSGPSDLRADYLAYLDALEDRSSTSTARPSLSELYAGLYQKPKIRLGPRPSAEGNAARAAAGARPISSLPQGLRAAPRKELHSANRPPQKQAAIDPIIRLPPPPPIPEVPQVPELIRPSSSAASVRSMPTTLASQSGKRTPEKKRLQKAMEMRKKQLAAARSREADGESGVGESPSKRRDEPVLESKVDLRPAAGNGPPQFSIPSFGAKADGKREVPQTFFDDATESPPLPQKEFETASPKHLANSPLRDGPALPAPEISPEAPRDDATAITTTADGSPDHAREEPSPTAAPDRTQEMQQDNQSEARGLGITDQDPPQAATSSGEAKSPIPEPPSASTPTSTRRAGPSALSALDDLLALDTPEQTSMEFPPRDAAPVNDTTEPPFRDESVTETTNAEKPTQEVEPSEDTAEPKSREEDQCKTETVWTPPRPYAEHLKADSGVQIEVKPDPTEPATERDNSEILGPTDTPAESASQQPSNLSEASNPTSLEQKPEPATAGEPAVEQRSQAARETTKSDYFQQKAISPKQDGTQPARTPMTPTTPLSGRSRRRRRQGLVSPVALHPATPTEESEFDVSDDDLMNELEEAEVQEAKPMPVTLSRSPREAHFPKTSISGSPGSPPAATSPRRKASQPLLKPTSGQTSPGVTRSASSGQLSKMPGAEGSITVAKSVNISSGISQRIKALARNSSSSDQLSLDRVPSRESTGKSISALRKSSLGSGATRPFSETPPALPLNARERVVSMARDAGSPDVALLRASHLPTTTPPKDSIHAVYNVSQQTGRPESISVTARIVRDDRTQKPSLTAPSQIAPLELHESPLVIEHHRRTTPVSVPPRLHTAAIESSPEQAESTPPSSPTRARSIRTPTTPSQPRSSTENWRSSFSLGRSRRSSDSKAMTSMVKSSSSTSLGSNSGRDAETASEKRGSVSSRMLKRMSNSISLGRKTITQIVGPTLEEPTTFVPELVPEDRRPGTAYAAEIGDLNVQLPDTLLWKRRWVEIDEYGNFVVKMSKSNEMANTRNNTKAFHLSELKKPLLPDHERQEMPNSVVLDFVDGRTMQCACETAGGQREVLRLLQEAHNAYTPR